ncbi:granzyme K-like [Pyrgilauda ruficollis]|uniref:granzyme K-like n=1 Tax=Pyrgilauda ruficollis TaxID=221976 RepID=UPI001B87FFC3|nr:granzyme K-like [Pyrgilauda ruficollis]
MDIVGAHEVHPHSWPYVAAIQDKNLGVCCGGALLERQWVLTTVPYEFELDVDTVPLILSDLGSQTQNVTHVVFCDKEPCPFDKLNVSRSISSPGAQQIFGIMETFPHYQFDWPPFDNGIMLLKLNDTAKLNKYVQLLALPDFFEDVEPGTLCQVAGWGDTSPGKPSKYLRKTTLKIVSRKAGDSGGPLICAGQCCGMVSFGEERENISIPGVYTQLTEEYIGWIKRTVRQIYETRAF